MPIPAATSEIKIGEEIDQYGNRKVEIYKVPFETFFGRDKSGNKIIVERILNGEYKLKTSSIQFKKIDKFTKIYFLMTIEIPEVKAKIDPEKVLKAELNIENPIIARIGKRKFEIGNKEEYYHKRLAIQSALKRVQISNKFNSGGKGRKKKTKTVDYFHKREKNFVETKVHTYSRELIDIALKNGCGKIILEKQSDKEEEAKKDKNVLRNWSYYGLKEKIKYKAKYYGIDVVIE
jgi:IS605 OrfB family transposase